MHWSYRRTATGGALFAALAAVAVPLGAQATPPVQAVGADSVELNFRDTPVQTIIAALAELAGLNVTYGPLNAPSTTLRMTLARADARRTLEALVRGNGLRMSEDAGLIRIESAAPVAPVAPVGPVVGAPGRAVGPGGVQLFVYPLRHAEAAAMANTLRDLFGLGGRAYETGARATPLSQQLEEGQRIPLPGEATPAPRSVGGGGFAIPGQPREGTQIVPDTRTNSLLIRGTQADYETVLAAVQQLDVRPLQVMIEVLIVEVRRRRGTNLGFEVRVPNQREPETGSVIGGEFIGGTPGNLVVRVLEVGGIRADVIIRALAESADATILSRPIILAQNNVEARILVGDQRPFVQVSRTLPTDGAVRDEVIQYRDVGTELTIVPTINPDGYVTLNVLQEVSNATSETQFGAPVISTREAQTQLLVKDRHTAVIGGLIAQERGSTATGIPVLRDLPLVGRLFRSEGSTRVSTELFLLLTPHVLRTDEDVEDATRNVEEGTRGVGPLLRKYDPLTGRDRPLKPKPGS